MSVRFAAAAAMMVCVLVTPVLAQDVSGEALAAHNALRAKHGVPPLSWSGKLAATAQAWADKCVFEHSNNGGENLAQGSGSPSTFINDWYSEIGQHDFANPEANPGTGHFTQVIWASSKSLGCGLSQCGGNPLFVCNYSPAGNLSGAYVENVPPVR